jgi:hypothetical protein
MTRENCPSPGALRRAIECEDPVGRRLEIVDHLADCSGCAADWRAARAMGFRPMTAIGRRLRRIADRVLPWRRYPWRRWFPRWAKKVLDMPGGP